MMKKILHTNNDITLTIVRIVLGVIFFCHGAQKTLGWFGGYGFKATMGFFTQQMGIPAPFAFLAIMAEFLGGIGLVLGLLTRVAAFGICIEMLLAVFMIHAQFGLFMNWSGNQKGEGFEYHLITLAITFVLMVKGAGAYSVDRAISAQRGDSGS